MPKDSFSADFPKELVSWFLNALDESTRRAYKMIWTIVKELLIKNWMSLSGLLLFILFLSFLFCKITKTWGTFASILYHYLYLGFLLLIVLIFGPEVFASNYFNIVLALLYGLCFYLVGVFVKKIHLRK